MIKIWVHWDTPDEIPAAQMVQRMCEEALDLHGMHSGQGTVHQPKNTFGIWVPEHYTRTCAKCQEEAQKR